MKKLYLNELKNQLAEKRENIDKVHRNHVRNIMEIYLKEQGVDEGEAKVFIHTTIERDMNLDIYKELRVW